MTNVNLSNILVNTYQKKRKTILFLLFLFLVKRFYSYLTVRKLTLLKFLKNYVKKIPYIKNKIINETGIFKKKLKLELNEPIKSNNLYVYDKLSVTGLSFGSIIDIIKQYQVLGEYKWGDGKVSGTVYDSNDKLKYLMTDIFPIFYKSNPLHPDIFPGIRKMEAEIIHMCANFLKSKEPCAGSFTSGGTESIILACKAYRDIAHQRGIANPSILVCSTGHAAYWKAAQYLGINIIETPYYTSKDKTDLCMGKLTLKIVKKYITSDTIAVVTSAPSFNFGLVDCIVEIANYCYEKNIFNHIDMCLGGFILPFIKDYDHISFETKGVTSISLDTHKYGCGPKGGSVILYNKLETFKHQMFVKENWSGGIYGTCNISGSRSGNIVAMTWASMMYYGEEGYQKNAEKIVGLTRYLKGELEKVNEVFIYGNPNTCIVAIGSREFNIYLLSDELKDKGWNLNVLQNPSCFHLCITNCHNLESIKQFIKDVESGIIEVKAKLKNNKNIATRSLYGSTQKINDSDIVSEVVKDYFCVLNDVKD